MSVAIFSKITHMFSANNGSTTPYSAFKEKAKWVVVAVVVLLVMLTMDYVTNKPNAQFTESDLLPELPIESQLDHSDKLNNVVTALYSQFDQPEEKGLTDAELDAAKNAEDSMSLTEQKQQSGLLKKLYIGDAIYRLSGIVKSTKFKAVLSVTYNNSKLTSADSASNETSDSAEKPYVTLYQGDNLSPYYVATITEKSIVLTDGSRTLWLALFTPQNNDADEK